MKERYTVCTGIPPKSQLPGQKADDTKRKKQGETYEEMALHDGLVNWPLLFGCALVGFGPISALFFTVVARRAQLVILTLLGAFTWMVSVLVTATIWQIPPVKTSLEATLVIGVLVQEAFRLLFFHVYTRTELAVQAVTTSKHQLPLHDLTSALAGGVGFALMHALMMYGSVLAASTGARGAAFSSSCDSIPLVFSAALSTLALTLLEVALMVVAFDGYRKRSALAVAAVAVIHMGVALSVSYCWTLCSWTCGRRLNGTLACRRWPTRMTTAASCRSPCTTRARWWLAPGPPSSSRAPRRPADTKARGQVSSVGS